MADLILVADTPTTTPLSAAFVVGPLVLPRKKHPCNTLNIGVCRLKYGESGLQIIALTGRADLYFK